MNTILYTNTGSVALLNTPHKPHKSKSVDVTDLIRNAH